LDNLSKPVQISSDKITELNVTLNATSYSIQAANIADPDFTGWAVSWGQIYALVDANQSIGVQGPTATTYLNTEYSAFTPMSHMGVSGVTPITIGASDLNNGSQWIQIQVKSPVDISSIKTMSILTLIPESSVSTIDV
jgi:hypothetical protein